MHRQTILGPANCTHCTGLICNLSVCVYSHGIFDLRHSTVLAFCWLIIGAKYSGTSLMRTPLGPRMCVQNTEASVFQGLPVEFPLGVAIRTRAFQHKMVAFLELWLTECW